MKKRNLILAGIAAVMILAASVPSALAYFTTYAEAVGKKTITLGEETSIKEEFDQWEKKLTITAEQDSEPVYVRARAFIPEDIGLDLVQSGGEGWSYNTSDHWSYYRTPISGKPSPQSASVLKFKISTIPETVEIGDNFNVVIVYEYTPVQYEENSAGELVPKQPTWDEIVTVHQRTTGTGGTGGGD